MASKRLSQRALAELMERAARARPQYQAKNEYDFKPVAGDSNYRNMVNWLGNAPGQAADLAGQVGEAVGPMFSMKTPPAPLDDPGRSAEMMADPSVLRPYESHSNLPPSPFAKTMWGMTGLGGMSDVVDSIPAVADDVGEAINDSTPGNVGTAALTALMALGSAFPFVPPLVRGSTDGKAGDALRRPGIGHNMPPSALDSVDLPPGSDPRYTGAAVNRTQPYPRYQPKNTTARMSRLDAAIADPMNRMNKVFDNYINRGRELGGPDWYNTEEMRDWMVDALGETEGHRQWKEFMELVGTTSTGAKVPQNIRMASFYRALSPENRKAVAQLVKDEGITPRAAAERLNVVPPNTPDDYAFGHLKQRNQAGNVINREDGKWEREVPPHLKGAALTKWLQANPKVQGFGNDLLGDRTNIAADMHFMRMLGMADGGGDFLSDKASLSGVNMEIARQVIGPRRIKKYIQTRTVNGKQVSQINLLKAWKDGHIKDTSPFQKVPTAWADTPKANEYAAYEAMANRVAKRYDLTPAQFQASLWMGAGDLTGLADESQGTFMDLFRRTLDNRAKQRGLTRREMLEEFIRKSAPLSVAGTAGAAGAIGATQMEREKGPAGAGRPFPDL